MLALRPDRTYGLDVFVVESSTVTVSSKANSTRVSAEPPVSSALKDKDAVVCVVVTPVIVGAPGVVM